MNPSQTAASPAPPQAQLAPTSKGTAGAPGSPFSSPQLFYEPTSVLEPHHLDSSPASDQLAADVTAGGGVACWDQKPAKYAPAQPAPAAFVASADDWDPLTCWLLDKDAIGPGELDYDGEVHHPAPPPSHQFPFDSVTGPDADPFDFLAPPFGGGASDHLGGLFGVSHPPLLQPGPPPSPPPFEQAHLEQLLRAAQAVDAGDRGGACAILARLNQNLPGPVGRPFQRAAFYLKDALHSLLLLDDASHPLPHPAGPPNVEVVRRIAAYKALCDLSPVPQFAAFTANQTVLEHLVLSAPGAALARPLHVVDFDIGLGGQWASFTHEFAARCRMLRATPPPVRITAIVQEQTLETRLVADNLREFAAALGVRLAFDVVAVGDAGPAALAAVRLTAGESLAVSFSPAVTRVLGGGRGGERESFAGFIRFVRGASPKVAVFVDTEYGCCPQPPAPQYPHSFGSSFIAGLRYYSAVLESLDAAASAAGGCGAAAADNVRRIERALVQPRVREAVRACGARPPRWREMLQGAGLRPRAFSEHAESQAKCLTGRFPVVGYHVARNDGALVLIWKDTEIAATSAWQC